MCFRGLGPSCSRIQAMIEELYIQSATAPIQYFHRCPSAVRRKDAHIAKSPSRAHLRREGNSPLFSTTSRVKLILRLLGSTKADEHSTSTARPAYTVFIRRCAHKACRTHSICYRQPGVNCTSSATRRSWLYWRKITAVAVCGLFAQRCSNLRRRMD